MPCPRFHGDIGGDYRTHGVPFRSLMAKEGFLKIGTNCRVDFYPDTSGSLLCPATFTGGEPRRI